MGSFDGPVTTVDLSANGSSNFHKKILWIVTYYDFETEIGRVWADSTFDDNN